MKSYQVTFEFLSAALIAALGLSLSFNTEAGFGLLLTAGLLLTTSTVTRLGKIKAYISNKPLTQQSSQL